MTCGSVVLPLVEACCSTVDVQGGAALPARSGRKDVAGGGCVEARPRLLVARWWRGLVGRQVSLVAGGLVSAGAGCCEAVGVLRAWGERPFLGFLPD
jgi:hypothetical protein